MSTRIIALWIAGMVFAGCGGEQAELGEARSALRSYNSLGHANLQAAEFQAGLLFAAGAPTEAALTRFAGTREGRKFLKYLAYCALPEGTDLRVKANRVLYAFPGALGLAPSWRTQPLTPDELQQLTAALMAHVNYFEVRWPISVRHPSLPPPDDREKRAYSATEGGFMGDPQNMTSCAGDTKITPWRICADKQAPRVGQVNKCGFRFAGKCFEGGTAADVCEPRDQDGAVNSCKAATGTAFPAIMVNLQPSVMAWLERHQQGLEVVPAGFCSGGCRTAVVEHDPAIGDAVLGCAVCAPDSLYVGADDRFHCRPEGFPASDYAEKTCQRKEGERYGATFYLSREDEERRREDDKGDEVGLADEEAAAAGCTAAGRSGTHAWLLLAGALAVLVRRRRGQI
jgi:hypothetical protein